MRLNSISFEIYLNIELFQFERILRDGELLILDLSITGYLQVI